MAQPMIKEIDQVAMVVKDAKATIRYMSDVLGIGPWVTLQFGDSGDGKTRYATIEDCVCEGEYIGTYSIDCCCCSMPNGVEIEVISPITGSSIFARYLERHGAGVQHISIVQDDFDTSIARMKEAGFEDGQLATVAEEETCAFVNHLSLLGSYLELHKRPPVMKPMDDVDVVFVPGPDPETKPEAPALFSQIDQVTVVTGDVDAAAEKLESAYGLGPWEKSDNEKEKSAVCNALNLSFRLVTPLDPESYNAKLLKKNGTDISKVTVRRTGSVPEGVEVKEIDGAQCIDMTESLGTLIELV